MTGPQYAVIDVETTGLGPQTDRIVELAVVIADERGVPFWEWSTRFNPEGPVRATHIHGITDADVAAAPRFRDHAKYLAGLLERRVVVAHNAEFDEAFLRAEFRRAGWDVPPLPTVCTLRGGRTYLPALGSWTLSSCCTACNITHEDAHSALGDARAVTDLLGILLTRTDDGGAWLEWPSAAARAASLRWPTSPTLPVQPAIASAREAGEAWQQARMRKPKRRSERLLEAFDRLVLDDVLDEGAPESTVAYLTLLSDVIADGVITLDERAALDELAHVYQLTHHERAQAHSAFLGALAHLALLDGSVSRQERADLTTVSELLGQPTGTVAQLIERAEAARHARLSRGLGPLPDDWALGEPLRVGDKVVVTGCYDFGREDFEARAQDLGVRIVSSVSSRTAMLVSDGAMDGGKAAEARVHGTRVVHPTEFVTLLTHLQPARPATGRHQKAIEPATEGSATLLVSPGAPTPGVVREWARDAGYLVGERGSVPREIVLAYLAANRCE
jgi:DNA polymerase-3 subunit epsilon